MANILVIKMSNLTSDKFLLRDSLYYIVNCIKTATTLSDNMNRIITNTNGKLNTSSKNIVANCNRYSDMMTSFENTDTIKRPDYEWFMNLTQSEIINMIACLSLYLDVNGIMQSLISSHKTLTPEEFNYNYSIVTLIKNAKQITTLNVKSIL